LLVVGIVDVGLRSITTLVSWLGILYRNVGIGIVRLL
jgi:hypothetical protein